MSAKEEDKNDSGGL